MPIRSPHGRAAAYRALWQWPLRSPRRLAITVLVVLALAAGRQLRDRHGDRLGPRAADRPGSPPARRRCAPRPRRRPPRCRRCRRWNRRRCRCPRPRRPRWTWPGAGRRAWVRPAAGTSTGQWLDGLRGTTTDEYLGVLAAVDPANIPAGRVIGNPKPVRVSPRSVQVQVQTDGPTLLVLVVDTEAGWRVAGYDRTSDRRVRSA